tara:strand:- start:3233 stop:3877 length:645 start_codon:yes stop_codon:yes gene_type:complete
MQVCKIKGVPIRIHYSLVIFASLILSYAYLNSGLHIAIYTAQMLSILFVSVFLHELGHSFAAKKFEMETRSITLYPFGGIAMVNMASMTPKSEMIIAIAGPMTNFLIMLLSIPAMLISVPFSIEIFFLNTIMCFFNMIPAFPMDGGRVLRAALSFRMDSYTATLYCIRISGLFSLLFLFLGIMFSFMSLAIVGVVLLFMLSNESKILDAATKSH